MDENEEDRRTETVLSSTRNLIFDSRQRTNIRFDTMPASLLRHLSAINID